MLQNTLLDFPTITFIFVEVFVRFFIISNISPETKYVIDMQKNA